VLTEGKGVPLAIVISGANTHDIKLLEETLDSIVIFRPLPSLEKPQNLCLVNRFRKLLVRFEKKGGKLSCPCAVCLRLDCLA